MKNKILPFTLTFLAIILDQLSKAYIVKNWPRNNTFITDVFNNDFLWIYHVRNPYIAFSMGQNLPDILKPVVIIVLPVLLLVCLVIYYFKTDEFTNFQRWVLAGIVGGGIGNLIDRIFRSEGVVDFISVKVYGLFGMERWPTFNFADSFVVVCGILLLISVLFAGKESK